MKTCINNTIQKYLEDGIAAFKLKDTEDLYELYKDIRITIAERGQINAILCYQHADLQKRKVQNTLTNPKIIAASLIYHWGVINGIWELTQITVAEFFNIGTLSIGRGAKIIAGYFANKTIGNLKFSNDGYQLISS